jgi:hypothetical protein
MSQLRRALEPLYPAKVWTFNVHEGGNGPDQPAVEVDYKLYQETVATKRVGDLLRHDLAAPGYGYREYRIVLMNEVGVYAILVKDRGGILTEAMVE